MNRIRDALYLASVFAGAFAVIAVSWAAVGIALGIAVKVFLWVVG